jgi:hypothetical protein
VNITFDAELKAIGITLTSVPVETMEEILDMAVQYVNEPERPKRVILRSFAEDYCTGLERCATMWRMQGDPRIEALKVLTEDLVRDQAGFQSRQGYVLLPEELP